MKNKQIKKENLEFNSKLLDLLMDEIACFIKTFDFREVPYINFCHFLSEILENETEIDDRVTSSISDKLNGYIKDHILSLGEDLDIKEFFSQRGIHVKEDDFSKYLCNETFISVDLSYKHKIFCYQHQYITRLENINEMAMQCFATIVDGIVFTEISRIKKELELERASKEMIKIK